jgi:hypothetical protein
MSSLSIGETAKETIFTRRVISHFEGILIPVPITRF